MKLLSKKCLSLLLCAILVLGLLPAAAGAEALLPTTDGTVAAQPIAPAPETPAPTPAEPEAPAADDATQPEAALAAEPLPDYDGDWIYFRGNPENNGVTEAATPASAETAGLKWAQKLASGFFSSFTPPLLVNGNLYLAVDSKVLMLDTETGTALMESKAMAGSVGFAMNPIAYGGGMIFVPLSSGRIQALRADNLELLWVSDKLEGLAQTVSPILYRGGYVYTGIWNGETTEGSYFCLNAETGKQVWSHNEMGGFYWAGAYVSDQYLIVGSGDSAPENSHAEDAALLSLDPKTGAVIDRMDNMKGDIRSSICYDNGRVYFATKGGWFYSLAVGADGRFGRETLQSVDLKGMCTGTPMIYNQRAYIGSSGAAQFSGPGYLNVIDLSDATPELAYRAELPGYPQASALATSAYGDTAFVYITYNQRPGGIYAIKDQPGQTEAEGYSLFTPEKAQQNYGICSLVCDADGTLYYKNDSGHLMAVARNATYATSISMERTLLLPSGTATLRATAKDFLGEGEPESLIWSSSNPEAATVAQDGTVTYVGNGVTTITAAGALTSASCTVTCGTPAEGGIYVVVSAYDYTAKDAGLTGASATGEIMKQVVEIPATGTAASAVEAAFKSAGVSYTLADSYVSSINGLAAGTGGGMSGWLMSYNNDDFSNLGLGTLSLVNGDRLDFHYSVNPDGMTDDVGNGFYGLPIVSTLTLAGRTVTMSKETTFAPDYSSHTDYYIHSQQGTKVKLQGAGTASDPFQIPITLPYGSDLTKLTAAYTTTLNGHYQTITGLDGAQDYTDGLSFSLATLGGRHKTYYKVLASTESGGGTPPSGSTISVSFRLIGSTLSSAGVDLGTGDYAGASYQTWLPTTTVTLPKQATVYDLFTQALDAAGIRYTGADRNYVETIYAPAAVGGYALSEFANGARSGWMYTINGTHPGFGLKDHTLHQGDQVVWHYVNDYGYEVADWFEDDSFPSLGNGKYYNAWLKAADTAPTAPGGGSTSAEKPADGLTPAATTDKNGVAKASVSTKAVERAVTDAKKTGAAEIVIAPVVTGSPSKVSVELPGEAVAAVAKGGTAALTVKTSIARISLPTAALNELGKAEGKVVTLSAETVKDTAGKPTGEIRIEITAGGKTVEGIAGGLTVALPVTKATSGTVLVLVTDAGADILKKSVLTGTTLSALLPGSATVVVKENTQTFTDVDAGYWGRDAVNFVASRALLQGTGTATFDPAGNMSRAMLFTVLARMEGQDITGGDTWYDGALLWAKEQGISDGAEPNESITREQLAVMLYRYAKAEKAEADLSAFSDGGSVSPWAADAMAWAVKSGILTGKGSTLDPQGTATRGEVAAMLQRLIPLLLT